MARPDEFSAERHPSVTPEEHRALSVSTRGLPSSERFRLICEVGQGGMATVYLALMIGDAGFNKLVALKQPQANLAEDEEFLGMFLDEARLAARLNHPHVVQTYEVGRHAGGPFIAMEFLEGQPLHRVQRTVPGGIPLPIHLRIIADALSGLHHAHELRDFNGSPLSVVHRDVSPQNLLVSYDGATKVVDFGIAKATTAGTRTELGLVKGKLPYMSPEQILGEHLDRRADIFSIGVMLWEAGAKARLWPNESARARLRLISQADVPKLSESNSAIPRSFDRVCRRALAYVKTHRYQTAAELEADVDGLLAELGTPATRREVGEFMCAHFDAERSRVRKLIEEHAGHVKLDSARKLPALELMRVPAAEWETVAPRSAVHTPLATRPLAVMPEPPVRLAHAELDTPTTAAPATANAREANHGSSWRRRVAFTIGAIAVAAVLFRLLPLAPSSRSATVQASEASSGRAVLATLAPALGTPTAAGSAASNSTTSTTGATPTPTKAPARVASPASTRPSVVASEDDLPAHRKRPTKPQRALDTSDPWSR